jgi:predicted RNA binding protein YcfA (HicA-like mRNA interferase family)
MKIRQIKPKDLLKALLKLGFVVERQKGSHVFLEGTVANQKRFTSISIHNEPLPKGTLKAVLKQTGVSEEDIKKHL